MTYELKTCTTAEEFSNLRSAWDDLVERSQYPIPHWRHTWVSSWLKSYWQDKPLCFLVVWDESRLVAAAPFVIDSTSFYGAKMSQLRIASSSVTTANFFIVDREHLECVELISHHLSSNQSGWAIGELTDVPQFIADHFCACLLASRPQIHTLRRPGRNSPYLPLVESYQDYLDSQSKNFRYDVRRCSRNIQAAGTVSIKRYDDQLSISDNLDIAIKVSAKSWKKLARTDMAGTNESKLFYQSLCQSTDMECRPILWILYLDDKPIAIQFYIADRFTVHLLRSDFDENYSKLRPGAHLQNEVIRDCYAMNFRELNFGGMDYSYKMRYTKHTRHHDHIDLFNSRLSSLLLCKSKRIKRFLQSRLTPNKTAN